MEMALKLIAFGLKEYCKNKWNLFDGTIVILSVLDMALTYSETIEGAGLSVLRTFRLVSRYNETSSYNPPALLWTREIFSECYFAAKANRAWESKLRARARTLISLLFCGKFACRFQYFAVKDRILQHLSGIFATIRLLIENTLLNHEFFKVCLQ